MSVKVFPVIDLTATGNNIRRLRMERGLTVRDLQNYFGFEEPRAIYKWQKGESLPTVDNLYALGKLFGVPMDQILVPTAKKLHTVGEQQGEPCCSYYYPIKGFKKICETELRQTRRTPQSIMEIYGQGGQRSMAQFWPQRY